jgi:type I restriction enzyme S subunit
MFASRVTETKLTERLDAEFYRPAFLLNESLLLGLPNSNTVGAVADQVKLGYTGPIDSYYGSPGALFLTSKNVAEGKVEVGEGTERIRYDIHNGKLASTRAKIGDLLLSRTGTVGKAAVLHDKNESYNFAAHLFAVRLKKSVDADFLAAFFNSKPGRLQSERMQRGTIIQGLSIYDIPGMKVPEPPYAVQRFIGDKVRQAERLRAFAGEMETSFKKAILKEFPEIDEHAVGNFRHNRALPREIESNLNPGNFNPDRVKVRSYLKSNGGLKLATKATVQTPTTSSYSPHDRYIGLDAIGSATGTINASTIGNEDVVGTVRLLPEGPVISKLRPYLNKVAYIPSELAGSCGSTELLCVRGESPELNWYLCGVLSLQSTVRQLVPVSTGSTHPRVTREDVLDVFIPWIKTPEIAGKKLALAQRAYVTSDRLIAVAKLLVEALIERKVTEDELIYAQTRLEQGDDAADRAILSRLFEGGWDAKETRPLFPDLDAYYETLRMVEREQTEATAK